MTPSCQKLSSSCFLWLQFPPFHASSSVILSHQPHSSLCYPPITHKAWLYEATIQVWVWAKHLLPGGALSHEILASQLAQVRPLFSHAAPSQSRKHVVQMKLLLGK